MGTSARRRRSVRGSARPALVALLAVLMFGAGVAVTWLWMSGRVPNPFRRASAPSPAPTPVPTATPVEPSPEPSPVADESPEPSPAAVADAPGTGPRRPRTGGRTRPAPPAAAPKTEPGAPPAPGTRAVTPASAPRFVLGTTHIESLKPVARDLKGFDSAGVGVKRAPEVEGVLDLVVEPARITPGQPYVVKVFLKNQGRRPIKVDELKVSMIVDGRWSARPLPPKVKEIKPSERALLEELPGIWKDSIRSWAVEVVVTSSGQDVYRNRLSWQ